MVHLLATSVHSLWIPQKRKRTVVGGFFWSGGGLVVLVGLIVDCCFICEPRRDRWIGFVGCHFGL